MKEVSKKFLVLDVITKAYSPAACFLFFFHHGFLKTVDKLATMSNSVSKENI